MTDRTEVDFDHHSAALVDDINGEYDRLREACPVAFTKAHGGYWVVSSHERVAEVATNHQIFRSDNDPNGEREGFGGNSLPSNDIRFGFVESDGEYWAAVRRFLNPRFSPPAVERWRPVIRDITTACIDRIIESGQGDFIADIASPVPAVLTLRLLGFPIDRWRLYADVMHDLNRSVEGTPERTAARAGLEDMIGELTEFIEQRTSPDWDAEDLFTDLCRAELNGRRLSREELLGEALLLVNGGVDTTTSVTGSAFAWLSTHPDEWDELRSDPEKLKIATEEFLRFFAPVTAMARTAASDYQLGGETIHANDRILMSFVGANRDPAVFDAPDELRLDRWPNRHTSFGLGIHRCIGSNLARAIVHIVMEESLRRLTNVEIDFEKCSRYPDQGVNQGWSNLPMVFTPAEPVGSDFRLEGRA